MALLLAHRHRQNRAKKQSDDWLGRYARTRGRYGRRRRRALRLKWQFQVVEIRAADRKRAVASVHARAKCAVVVLSAGGQFIRCLVVS